MRILSDRIPPALPEHGFAVGDLREIIGTRPHVIVRLADGRFRVGDRAGPDLGSLVEALPEGERLVSLAEARCADRFDRAAARLPESAAEAFEIARDALVELDDLAPFSVGHGACPRVDAVDFDGVARLIRKGETAMALCLARDGVRRLAATIDRPPPPGWTRAPSVLDGWFTDDPTAMAAACAAVSGDASVGSVTRVETFDARTGKAVVGGLHCPVLFGCPRQRTCPCSALTDASGTCDRCGVTVGTLPARDTAFAHLDFASDVLHPGAVRDIAAVTGTDLDTVHRILRGDADPEDLAALLDALPADAPARIRRAPIVPPGDRPHTLVPGPADSFATFVHPIDQAALALCNRTDRVRRLIELGAPPIIISSERHRLQAHLTAYFEAVRAPAPRIGLAPAHAVPVAPLEEVEWQEPPAGPAISSLVWTDGEHLVVQIGRAIHLIEHQTGATHRTWAADHRLPRFVHDGMLGCASDYPNLDYSGVLCDMAPRVIETGRWLDEWPADMPCALVEKDQPEDGLVVLPTRDFAEEAWPASDRPAAIAWTNDGRALWVGEEGDDGALVWADTAVRQRLPLGAGGSHFLGRDGALFVDPFDDEPVWGPAAIHVGAAFAILQADGVYSVGGRGQWRLAFDWTAAGFSPTGDRLAIGTADGEILIIDPADPAILSRYTRG